ncbi:hypothetical protein HZC27_01335 [Candidatus Roizmanbacteria bacterium]|nr:hypothetical protein [Candidatus Roizmanbacteria bacterium]
MKKGFGSLTLILVIVLIAAIGGGAYYLGTRSAGSLKPESNVTSNSQSSSSVSTQSSAAKVEPLFSGKVTRIIEDLKLFKPLEGDVENGVNESIVYYEAGTYLKGPYQGYKRILAIRPSEGPGPSLQFILATKDMKMFVLDDPEKKSQKFPESDWDSPFMYLDKNKISAIAAFDSEHPATVSLQSPYALIREEKVLLENIKSGKKDKNGYDIYIEKPITEFEKKYALTSSVPTLSFFGGGVDWGNTNGMNDKEKKMNQLRVKYLSGSTKVFGADSTGLTYSYILTSQKVLDKYLADKPLADQKDIEYKKQVELFNQKKLKEYPQSPDYLKFPRLRFNRADAQLSNQYYDTYDAAFPGACGGTMSTFIVDNIAETDLELVSSNFELPLFTLKDEKHPLYELAYDAKTNQDDESYKSVNDGKSKPTLAQYVAKRPLLFFKDSWGRWAVVGEFDIKLMGGCGKPVIYLYPEKTTAVHVDFVSPIKLDTQIPQYHNGWLVSADPQGNLKDLQPSYTDCSQIDGIKTGSEYARVACQTNNYPYIYWSGKSVSNEYPRVDAGTVVAKNEVQNFMIQTLLNAGLNTKEVADMTGYWVPKMLEKNAPYYRISFLQTGDMDAFIPMRVDPVPNTVYRIFLDYKPLVSIPSKLPEPQQLKKLNRQGFVLIEWGGLL